MEPFSALLAIYGPHESVIFMFIRINSPSYDSVYIILSLTWHNEPINYDEKYDRHTSSAFLSKLCSRSADDVTIDYTRHYHTSQLWRENVESDQIGFIYAHIQGYSCKKYIIMAVTSILEKYIWV